MTVLNPEGPEGGRRRSQDGGLLREGWGLRQHLLGSGPVPSLPLEGQGSSSSVLPSSHRWLLAAPTVGCSRSKTSQGGWPWFASAEQPRTPGGGGPHPGLTPLSWRDGANLAHAGQGKNHLAGGCTHECGSALARPWGVQASSAIPRRGRQAPCTSLWHLHGCCTAGHVEKPPGAPRPPTDGSRETTGSLQLPTGPGFRGTEGQPSSAWGTLPLHSHCLLA